MESSVTESQLNPTVQNQDTNKTDSAENFQKFVFDLFDKNGILNDLRAYLRGHLVDVLKSAQTGDPLQCQKHFTQRLDSSFQALNMLVAEYLLCLEFNYSLSVFVSELPLANMVFGLAKSLQALGSDGKTAGLRFGEKDIWSILNYLGVKCDSEHANAILEMYKAQPRTPLLQCILKCAQLCDMEPIDSVSHEGSVSSSSKSSIDKHMDRSRCRHQDFCKACRGRYRRVKEKYKKKKEHYLQKVQANAKALNVETLMKNIGEIERNLVDEMFEQLKTVYETEIDMFKAENDGKIKKSLASHAEHFQRMQNECEESYKAREAALEANIVSKKRFLWGLAQALRTQHSQMSKAMQAVNKQTEEIAQQERNLKLQRTEAEESLKRHAEEMRQQIADELNILESHLETMKIERESINRERTNTASETKMNMDVKNYLQNQHHLWKEELNVLKMYIDAALPKTGVERSTITDDGFKGMNNEIDRGLVREGRPNQVVNDLKKQKNVNFSQGKSEGESRASHSSSSSQDDRLRFCERSPPRVAPVPQRPPAPLIEHNVRETECGWRKGAGEERSLLPNARILVPGDTVPFVGVVGRRSDGRRHLLNRWRVLRRRVTPLDAALPHVRSDSPVKRVGIRVHSPSSEPIQNKAGIRQERVSPTGENIPSNDTTAKESPKKMEKTPSSVLKEAKEKLKTVHRPSASREESPSAVLREAKRRLRKLEIEAEAVERSYRDFRRRHELGPNPNCDEQPTCIPKIDSKMSSHYKQEVPEHSNLLKATDSMQLDLEKYLKKYQNNLDLGQDHFRNKNTATVLKNPVPEAYPEIKKKTESVPRQNYLEKPILEFRKLYYTNPERYAHTPKSLDIQEPYLSISSKNATKENSELRKERNNKQKELEIQQKKQDLMAEKMNDLQDEPTKETVEMSKEVDDTASNLLIVEVENVSEVKDLNMESDAVVVVESSVDSKEAVVEREDSTQTSAMMSILISPRQVDRNIANVDTGTPRTGTPSPQNVNIDAGAPRVGIPSPQNVNIDTGAPRVGTPSPQNDSIDTGAPRVGFPSPQNVNIDTGAPRVGFPSPQNVNIDTGTPRVGIPSPQNVNIDTGAPRVETPSPQKESFIDINTKEFYVASGDKAFPDYIQVDKTISEVNVWGHNSVVETVEIFEDYPDDFSDDVDNYKSEDNSPISLPKSSEDENFWD